MRPSGSQICRRGALVSNRRQIVAPTAAPLVLSPTDRVVQLVRPASREVTLAQVGLAVIAVHVLDDNFLQPQPGTSAADHLVSGLVPIGVLLLAGATYGRLRGGLRGSIAILFGALGITMGAGEAVYYSLKVGPSGDDYTGFLALAAGLLLIGVGVATLWKTRRSSGSLAWRYGRRVLLALGSAVAAYVLLLPFLLSYVFT